MKKLLVAFAFAISCASATAQVKMPQPSTTQTIKQDFGMGNIELVYSRPNAKGRKIFGDLVPYNDLWRTGANAATKLTFTDAVELGGKIIDTGSYVLYTIPTATTWTIVLNKGLKNWGVDGYKQEDDVVRFTVPSMKMPAKTETFTMQFANIKPEGCELHIMWENTAVSIPFKANIKDRLRAQVEAALQGEKKPYWQAVQFYNEYDNNKPKALELAGKAVEANPKAFWIWLYKAKLEKDLKDKTAATASAKKSLEEATAADNKDYQKMANELIDELSGKTKPTTKKAK
jgi:hypothetical protein